mgnify:CR=1 FL=1
MKIFIVVKRTDVEVLFGMCYDTDYVTETEILKAYGNKQDANFEARYLNQANKQDNILYDVIETELY